jgi:hypothetical protein
LTDNGMVFTTRLSGGKGGRNHREVELHRLRVVQINSTPNHPTTCGKVERFHQTLKRWLIRQPRAATLIDLHARLDTFVEEYSDHRPHRSLPHEATPATAYGGRPKAQPANAPTPTTVFAATASMTPAASPCAWQAACTTSALDERTHARTHVLMLVQDLDVRIINAATGALIRELTIDPTRDYQPRGVRCGRAKKSSEP